MELKKILKLFLVVTTLTSFGRCFGGGGVVPKGQDESHNSHPVFEVQCNAKNIISDLGHDQGKVILPITIVDPNEKGKLEREHVSEEITLFKLVDIRDHKGKFELINHTSKITRIEVGAIFEYGVYHVCYVPGANNLLGNYALTLVFVATNKAAETLGKEKAISIPILLKQTPSVNDSKGEKLPQKSSEEEENENIDFDEKQIEEEAPDLGNSPLHDAVLDFYEKAFTELIASPAGAAAVNTQNNNGQTPLHVAVCSQQTRAVEILLKQPSIRINIKDNDNKTAMEYVASSDPQNSIVQMLANHGTKTGKSSPILTSFAAFTRRPSFAAFMRRLSAPPSW